MSDRKKEPPKNFGGAVGGRNGSTLVLGLESPTDENHPTFPIEDAFPDSIEQMEFYQETLMKYLKTLRDLKQTQIESVKKFVEKEGKDWKEHLQQRKQEILKTLDWTDDLNYMQDWKDEDYLPECNRTVTHIQWIHLCRWTLHRKIEAYYKKNPKVPRLKSHSKQQTPDSISAFDGDSASHLAYVREKHYDQEFDEKSAVVAFNLCGASALTEKQIRNLETAMQRLLGEQEYKHAKHWTKEAIKMAQEASDQTMADIPSITLDSNTNKSDPQPPTAPNPSPASSLEEQLKEVLLERRDTLSGIPQLPEDSPEDSSIDQSEEVSLGHTAGDCTEDEASSPEEQTDRQKHYSHKMERPRVDDDGIDDTE